MSEPARIKELADPQARAAWKRLIERLKPHGLAGYVATGSSRISLKLPKYGRYLKFDTPNGPWVVCLALKGRLATIDPEGHVIQGGEYTRGGTAAGHLPPCSNDVLFDILDRIADVVISDQSYGRTV